MTDARTTRAVKNQPKTVKTRISVTTPLPKIPKVTLLRRSPIVAARAMMKSSAGKAIVTSMIREITASIQPRK
jgi:hypothetical protein